ncbi:hypothetical protein AZE42_12979, partial [Rhizopogon vesiculosus]
MSTSRRRSTSAGTRPPPQPSNITPPPQINTRRTAKSNLTQESIEALTNVVNSPESAEKFLIKKLLCHEDEPFTLTHLVSILFHITQISSATSLPVVTAIRAVAFLLKKHAVCEIADTVSQQISTDLIPHLVDNFIRAIAPQIAKVLSVSEFLDKTLEKVELERKITEREREEKNENAFIAAERLEEAADLCFVSLAECNKAITSLTPAMEQATVKFNLIQTPPTPSQPSPPPAPATFSSIVASYLPPPVDKALSRAALRARQITLNPPPGGHIFPKETLHADIVKKLREAISTIHNATTPAGAIRCVHVFPNGSITIEMDNENIATWIRTTSTRTALTNQLGQSIVLRDLSYPVILQYLPTYLQIEREGFLRAVEEENGIDTHSLDSIRWIKPLNRRSHDQRKAFTLLQVTDIIIANNIIKDGICIDTQKVYARKNKKEPIRCAKCQKFGHMARNCSSLEDTCGACGGKHRTSLCPSPQSTHCANCKTNQHASWSRSCPAFKESCDIFEEKNPENQMIYFPTPAIWTHAMAPTRPTKPDPPPPPQA